ncbi:WXG100 family type VII secretion target [Nocardia africana]|uniref:WXG100 family type VII secretion target n=1 Tax=Nocardia africana TaxID=134964 RepID=A0ABW6NB24_9NOCA
MLYERTVLQELSDLLNGFHKDLQSEASNLQDCAAKLAQAWEGNAGLEAFQKSKQKWDQQFGDINGDSDPSTAMGKVSALSKAVAAAMNNATAADKVVANGFGG